MYPTSKSVSMGRGVLFLIGLINIVISLIHFIFRNNGERFIIEHNLINASTIMGLLLAIIAIIQIAYGIWNIKVAIQHSNLLLFALIIEVIKDGCLVFLLFFFKSPALLLLNKYIYIGAFVLSAGSLVWLIVKKYTKQYIFFDNKSLFKY